MTAEEFETYKRVKRAFERADTNWNKWQETLNAAASISRAKAKQRLEKRRK